MIPELTPYQKWQAEMFGNILEHRYDSDEELENGLARRESDDRKVDDHYEHWFNEQAF